MTVLPELEDALREAARRPPRRRVLPALLPLAAAAAAVALAVVLVDPPPDVERPAATPAPAASSRPAGLVALLGETYGVFRRARTAADRLPGEAARGMAAGLRSEPRVIARESRLIARNGEARAWVAPARTRAGGPALCTFVDVGGGPGGGCGPFLSAEAARRPFSSRTTVRPGSVYFFLLPDGVRLVRFELRDGRRLTRPVRGNGVLLASDTGVRGAAWTDAEGTTHTSGFYDDPGDDTD